ncbi:hypothetical protein CQW23_14842 [Capsicum baccatum]|uniref:Deoxynucleoside kinase domain-containing protein n=1 Tax=Capsicum baccatum TaxID=33114 RepID=A0A2G2WKB7_CAPBA|nr:hypothetical protein CQW23_14842 [Capsicum baccatum]
MFSDPQKYAYAFQIYGLVTRVTQERESFGGIMPLSLMQRSVFSDSTVFVQAVYEANWMNNLEIGIYDSWFSSFHGLIPDGFIYLRASLILVRGERCCGREQRKVESLLEYLHVSNEKYESCLFPFRSGNRGVLSVGKLPRNFDKSVTPLNKGPPLQFGGKSYAPMPLGGGTFLVFNFIQCMCIAVYLLLSMVIWVPALVLDFEPNIDFNRDIVFKRQYVNFPSSFANIYLVLLN